MTTLVAFREQTASKGLRIAKRGTNAAAIFSIMASFTGSPVVAGTFGTAPGSDVCEPVYSVQLDSCEVTHVYRCPAEGGVLWHLVSYEPDDGLETDTYTTDAIAIDAWSDEHGTIVEGIEETTDPQSLLTARREGSDSFDYTYAIRLPIFLDPIPARYTGRLVNTDEKVEIDGTVFEKFANEGWLRFSAVEIRFLEDLYIDRDLGAVIAGKAHLDIMGSKSEESGNPVQLIRSGERGFMQNKVFRGCPVIGSTRPVMGTMKG